MKPRTAKKELIEGLEGRSLVSIAETLLGALELAYAANAIIDDEANGPAQLGSCLIGSDLEQALRLSEKVLTNLKKNEDRDPCRDRGLPSV